MNNKLHLVQKSVRLNCAWVVTGDAKMPLACIWIAAETPSAYAVTIHSEEVRMHLCA